MTVVGKVFTFLSKSTKVLAQNALKIIESRKICHAKTAPLIDSASDDTNENVMNKCNNYIKLVFFNIIIILQISLQ